MCKDSRCVMCDSKEVDDLGHFLVDCEEFQGGRRLRLETLRVQGSGWTSLRVEGRRKRCCCCWGKRWRG